jgi:hypothetical protein
MEKKQSDHTGDSGGLDLRRAEELTHVDSYYQLTTPQKTRGKLVALLVEE